MGKQWKQWQIFFSWTPKSLQMVTAAMKLKDACSLEEKTMISLNSILKRRYISLPTEVYLVKTMVFLVVRYECESWTIKKADHQKIDSFELWYWKRLFRVPWTTRRSNQFILKGIYPKFSLEGLMLKLKLHALATWWEELTHWKRPWCWNWLNAGGEGAYRGWNGFITPQTQWT